MFIKHAVRNPKWGVKQLLPLTYRTEYKAQGEKHFAVWKMWFGRCYKIDDVTVA